MKVRSNIDIEANPKDTVFIQRQFFGHTQRDINIHSKPIPKNPIWLYVIVHLLRFYQKKISPKLGNRCVYDPSCSRYSEQAFRQKGFFKGLQLTYKRLKRCTPKNGGIDLIK